MGFHSLDYNISRSLSTSFMVSFRVSLIGKVLGYGHVWCQKYYPKDVFLIYDIV